ncbi:MAG: membrane dipeptidase [bacterium]|jgi:membrane dipeptidase|nr:membrane dipeptidase [bacterium]
MNSRIPIIDLHQDLLLHINRRDYFKKDDVQTGYEMIKRNNMKLVVSTAFPIPPEENFFDPISNNMIEDEFDAYGKKCTEEGWKIIKTANDIVHVLDTENTGLLLHIEGLNVVDDNSWEMLERWYKKGWRSLGIVWNLSNPLGGGTKDAEQGLKPLGKKLIQWCEKKGIIVDFAHMNEPTFWDAAETVTRPIYISHGNCRGLCDNPRNYSDIQLKKVAETGGVIGLFFANTYVVGKDNHGEIKDLVEHTKHLIDLIGEDHIALGTDFGGIISGFVNGMESVDDLPKYIEALENAGFNQETIQKICYKNAARVLKQHLTL